VKPFYWVLIIFSTAFILRIPAFFNPIVDEDEAWYAVAANVINHGGLVYKDAVDLKPPLLFYIYALQFSIFGNDMRLLHFNTTFWILFTAFFIFKATTLLADRRCAYIAALLYVAFTPTFVPNALSTNAEILMNLPLVCVFYLFLKGEQSKQPFLFFLSGSVCCLAALIKYQAGIALPVMLGYLAIFKPIISGKAELKKGILNSCWTLLGFAAVLAILFWYLNGWETGKIFIFGAGNSISSL